MHTITLRLFTFLVKVRVIGPAGGATSGAFRVCHNAPAILGHTGYIASARSVIARVVVCPDAHRTVYQMVLRGTPSFSEAEFVAKSTPSAAGVFAGVHAPACPRWVLRLVVALQKTEQIPTITAGIFWGSFGSYGAWSKK